MFAEGAGGGRVGGEPGDGADGFIGGGRETGVDPREVAEGGVEQFAVEPAVAAAEAFFASEQLLEARGEIAVGGDVRAKRGEELKEDAALAGGGRGTGAGVGHGGSGKGETKNPELALGVTGMEVPEGWLGG